MRMPFGREYVVVPPAVDFTKALVGPFSTFLNVSAISSRSMAAEK